MMAMSLIMQKPEPASGKAWCVPPAVLQASLCRSASCAVRRVPVKEQARIQAASQRPHLQSSRASQRPECIVRANSSVAGEPVLQRQPRCQQSACAEGTKSQWSASKESFSRGITHHASCLNVREFMGA